MTTKPQTLLPLPDPPEREPDDMTSFRNLTKTGNVYLLTNHLGNPGTTIVDGERFIIPEPGTPSGQRIYPDMLVSFNADPTLYDQDNGYVISRQGKPPDLVLEIASRETGRNRRRNKPAGIRRPGHPGILALRPHRQLPRNQARRRPAGGWTLRTHRHRGRRRRRPARLQRRAEPAHPGGSTASSAGTTQRRDRKFPPSRRKGKRARANESRGSTGVRPRPESGNWKTELHQRQQEA